LKNKVKMMIVQLIINILLNLSFKNKNSIISD
jgi:hypothetical protein